MLEKLALLWANLKHSICKCTHVGLCGCMLVCLLMAACVLHFNARARLMKYEPWKRLNEHMLFTIIYAKMLQSALHGNFRSQNTLNNCQLHNEAKHKGSCLMRGTSYYSFFKPPCKYDCTFCINIKHCFSCRHFSIHQAEIDVATVRKRVIKKMK